MTLVRIPETLADELCGADGCFIIAPKRSGALGVVLEVLAGGSNVVTIFMAPEAIKESIEVIQSWLERSSQQGTVEVHGRSVNGQIVIKNSKDVEAAVKIIRAAFAQVGDD